MNKEEKLGEVKRILENQSKEVLIGMLIEILEGMSKEELMGLLVKVIERNCEKEEEDIEGARGICVDCGGDIWDGVRCEACEYGNVG